jgi:hypothetical protein
LHVLYVPDNIIKELDEIKNICEGNNIMMNDIKVDCSNGPISVDANQLIKLLKYYGAQLMRIVVL